MPAYSFNAAPTVSEEQFLQMYCRSLVPGPSLLLQTALRSEGLGWVFTAARRHAGGAAAVTATSVKRRLRRVNMAVSINTS